MENKGISWQKNLILRHLNNVFEISMQLIKVVKINTERKLA